MNATDSTIIIIPTASGATKIVDAKTGRPIATLPPGALEQQLALDDQLRADEIRRHHGRAERSQEMLCGLILGLAVVVGIAVGVLLTWI